MNTREAAEELADAILSDATDIKSDTEVIERHMTALLAPYKKWIEDLQGGMYINCVYCGHRYGPKDKTPVSKANMLREHIKVCPEHPLAPYAELVRVAKEERDAKEALDKFMFDEEARESDKFNKLSDTRNEARENLAAALKALEGGDDGV